MKEKSLSQLMSYFILARPRTLLIENLVKAKPLATSEQKSKTTS